MRVIVPAALVLALFVLNVIAVSAIAKVDGAPVIRTSRAVSVSSPFWRQPFTTATRRTVRPSAGVKTVSLVTVLKKAAVRSQRRPSASASEAVGRAQHQCQRPPRRDRRGCVEIRWRRRRTEGSSGPLTAPAERAPDGGGADAEELRGAADADRQAVGADEIGGAQTLAHHVRGEERPPAAAGRYDAGGRREPGTEVPRRQAQERGAPGPRIPVSRGDPLYFANDPTRVSAGSERLPAVHPGGLSAPEPVRNPKPRNVFAHLPAVRYRRGRARPAGRAAPRPRHRRPWPTTGRPAAVVRGGRPRQHSPPAPGRPRARPPGPDRARPAERDPPSAAAPAASGSQAPGIARNRAAEYLPTVSASSARPGPPGSNPIRPNVLCGRSALDCSTSSLSHPRNARSRARRCPGAPAAGRRSTKRKASMP